MVQILIVEDEPAIAELIRLTLKRSGYSASCVFDGEAAADLLETHSYDLILLDVMLPGIDGFALMEYIRPLGTPVIFITAKNALADKVTGLKLGADDYIVKPFEPLELLARVEVILRRYHRLGTVLSIGGLTIDTVAMTTHRGDTPISLTKTEYGLLLLFASNPGVALYREVIYERVWGGEFPYGSRTVDMHVQRLRRKVGWESCLNAVNGIGYRLEV